MKTWIALLRGLNVGGSKVLPMKSLVQVLEGLGLQSVKTYIQSGNAVFRAKSTRPDRLRRDIAKAIESRHGLAPDVLLLDLPALRAAMAANPFAQAEREPRSVHLYFAASAPTEPDLQGLTALMKESEAFELRGLVLYLLAPEGIGRSRLAARVEKALGVPVTARNWRSTAKILALAEALEA